MSSIVTNSSPSASPAWKIVTTFCWRTDAATCDSRWKRRLKSSSADSAGVITLSATTRFSVRSVAW